MTLRPPAPKPIPCSPKRHRQKNRAARLTRARKRLAVESFDLPGGRELTERLDLVAEVAYLAFTAGYAPGSGADVVRVDLAGEAIRQINGS